MRQDSIQVLIDSRRQNKVKEDLITAMVVTVKTRNNVKHRLTDTSPSLENTSFKLADNKGVCHRSTTGRPDCSIQRDNSITNQSRSVNF